MVFVFAKRSNIELPFFISLYFQESRSGPSKVHLRHVQWNTAGTYRCEVTADDFMTIQTETKAEVVGKQKK